jgi:hypothetical protein
LKDQIRFRKKLDFAQPADTKTGVGYFKVAQMKTAQSTPRFLSTV